MTRERSKTVLVVDDEPNLRKVLATLLRREGLVVLEAGDGQEALSLVEREPIDLLLSDLRMPNMDGMLLLKHMLERHREVPMIILTAHGTVDTAVEAMKLGAFDFLSKPFDRDELRIVVGKALAASSLAYDPGATAGGRHGLIGQSEELDEVFHTIEKVSKTPATVLITGESGTGKELVASAIHNCSERSEQPFIRINCAAIPRELIESELFGYEKGAFTGAITSKPGRFELADGGTLFLDEIGEVPPEMQVKLLRALQESEFERVGGVTTTHVDVRLIAATNRDLKADIGTGRFREDLYYRLNVVPVELPPLRRRAKDIPALAEHFVNKHARRLGKPESIALSQDALAVLECYPWPGNIRELENVIERAVLFSEDGAITPSELPDPLRTDSTRPRDADAPPPGPVGPLKEIVRAHTESLEKNLIGRALEETGGNVTKAARQLQISRKSLQNKMRDFGLRDPEKAQAVDTPEATDYRQ